MKTQSLQLFIFFILSFFFLNQTFGQNICTVASDEPSDCFLNSSTFAGTTETYTTSSVLPNITGFNCNSITNDAWVRIIPICSEIEIKFNTVNCRPRIGPQGVGVAVMDEHYQVIDLCYVFPTIGFRPKRLTLDDLTPGKAYHLMLYNSLEGLNCQYQMEITGIMTYGLNNSDMYGEFVVGEGSTVKYFVENPGASATFKWTTDPGLNIISGQDSYGIITEVANVGSYEICCEITRIDDSIEKICKTVQVNSTAPEIQYEIAEFCPRSCYDFGNECRDASGVYQHQTTDAQGNTIIQILELCENQFPKAFIYGDRYIYINGCLTDVTIRGGIERNAGNTSIYWVKRGDGRIPNTESEEFTTSEAGTYGFVVEDETTGCTDTAFVQVWVNLNCQAETCICESNLIFPDTTCGSGGPDIPFAGLLTCETHLGTTREESYVPNNIDCSTVALDSGQWFKFVADSTIIELSIIPFGCDLIDPGGLRTVLVGKLASTGSNGLFDCSITDKCQHRTIRSDDFIKGETYFLGVEAVIGDPCDFAIIFGFQQPFFATNIPRDSIISAEVDAPCINRRIFYEAPVSERVDAYKWQIVEGNGAILSGSTTNRVGVEWFDAGIGKLSMIATNDCSNKDTFFLDVKIRDETAVNNMPPMLICPQQFPLAPSDYCNSPYCPGYIVEPGTFCVDIPIPGNYCDSIVCYTFIKTRENVTVIDTSICADECINWNNQQICDAGTFRVTTPSIDGCVDVLELRVRETNLDAEIDLPGQYHCIPDDPFFITASTASFGVGIQHRWVALDGGMIVSNSNPQSIDIRGTGRYVLNLSSGNCFASDTVFVSGSLPTPQISCRAQGNTITFSWQPILGAINYNVSIDGISQGAITGTTFTTNNLSPLQNVEIEVSANGIIGCASTTAIENCQALECQGIDLEIEPIASFCVGQNLQSVQLNFQQTGGMGGGTAVWSGQNISSNGIFDPNGLAPGDYQINLSYSEGNCSATDGIQLNINPNYSFFDTLKLCTGDEFDFYGMTISTPGNYEFSTTTVQGCDSTFYLEAIPARDTTREYSIENICEGDTVSIFGNDVFEAGIYSTIDDDGLCLKRTEVEVFINQNPNTFDTISTCEGQSIPVFGISTDVAGTYFETFNSSRSCDSMHAITLMTNDTFFFFQPIEICANQTVDVFGVPTNLAGIYTQTLLTSEGCDSNFVIELKILDTLGTIEPVAICENDSVLIFGNFEDAAGIYSETFSSLSGCDSVHSIELRLNPNFAFFDTLPFCLGDTLDFFGTPIFEEGEFQHIEQTNLGCDSIFNVKVIPARDTAFFAQSENICRGDTILVFGNEVYESGIFIQVDDNGFCVTVEEFEVTINEISETFDTLNACLGSPVPIFGFETDVSNTYLETYNRIGNCDSIHSIHLIAKDTFLNTEKLQICSNQEADIFGDLTNVPGIYTQNYSAQNGCDSTSVIELLVSDTLRTEEIRNFCQNDSILVFGNYETMPGSYLQNALSMSGCDSIHEVVLEYFPDFQFIASAENTCFEDSSGSASILIDNLPNAQFVWENGSSESTISDLKPGFYQFTVTDENGCEKTDSVLVENESFEIISDELPPLCFGESNGSIEITSISSDLEFSLNGAAFSNQNIFENLPSGNYSITVRNSNNCILKTEIELSDPDLFTVSLPEDTLINLGESIELIPNSNGLPSSFSWEPDINLNCSDCPTVIARPEEEITYFLQIEDVNGCFASDSILIEIIAGNKYFIPSAFSPNGDGDNDFFTVYGNRNLKKIQKLLIFDNWGELIWKGEDFPPNINDLGWDGKFREIDMNNGVFVFYMVLEFSNGETVIEKGDITLIR